MPEYEQFLTTVKLAAAGAVQAGKPCAITYGMVKSIAPLVIAVDQKLELSAAQLILTTAVREHRVEITVEHWTEPETDHTHSGEVPACAHTHAYQGRKTVLLHQGLQPGERVVLVRVQGGQQYLVLDRVEVAG